MGLKQNQWTQVGIEGSYGDGGASFTDMPIHVGAFPDFSPPVIEQPVYRASRARNTVIMGGATVKVPIKFYLKGAGAAGTAPEIGKLLRAAALSQTIVGATSVTYKVRDTGEESIGFKHNLDGIQHWLKGARIGTGKLTFAAGKPALFEGNVEGLYVEPTAVALSAPTYADLILVPPIMQSMALTIGGNAYIVPSLEVDMNNNVNMFESVNAGNLGINSLDISDLRDWKFKFRVRRDANNDVEFYTALTSGTELALASTGFGTAGNKIAVNMSKIQLTKVMPVDEKGMIYYDCEGNMNYDATTEFSLVFT